MFKNLWASLSFFVVQWTRSNAHLPTTSKHLKVHQHLSANFMVIVCVLLNFTCEDVTIASHLFSLVYWVYSSLNAATEMFRWSMVAVKNIIEYKSAVKNRVKSSRELCEKQKKQKTANYSMIQTIASISLPYTCSLFVSLFVFVHIVS